MKRELILLVLFSCLLSSCGGGGGESLRPDNGGNPGPALMKTGPLPL